MCCAVFFDVQAVERAEDAHQAHDVAEDQAQLVDPAEDQSPVEELHLAENCPRVSVQRARENQQRE